MENNNDYLPDWAIIEKINEQQRGNTSYLDKNTFFG